jgi:CheY-like chemotaxis protein
MDKIRLKLQLQKVCGVTSQLSKILRKDMQSVISDAILNKCSTSQLPSFFMHSPAHHPPSFICASQRALPSMTAHNFVINEEMEVAEEEITSINHLPHPMEPKMLSKFPRSSIQVQRGKDKALTNEFCLEKLVSKLSQRIKLCSICKCPTILIVDDNDFIRFFLQKQLTSLGFTSDQAINGKIAVDKVFEKSKCVCKGYKLVFMDYDMPVLDGVKATRQIINGVCKGKVWRDIVIVGVSAFSSKQDIMTCMNAGMKDFSIRIT